MAKIQITGYIYTDDMDDAALDPADPSGLSNTGYEELMETEIEELNDIRIRVVTK